MADTTPEAMMTKLSLIAAEAQRLVKRMSEARRSELQDAIIELCETHWHELRGMQPPTPLAQVLWSVTPPLAELFVDLHAEGDGRLMDILAGLKPMHGLALLVLAEIERGDIEATRIAYESMMLFESTATATIHTDHIGAALRSTLHRPQIGRQFSRAPLQRALAIITEQTGRHDSNAVATVIRLLTDPGERADAALDSLHAALQAVGVRFLGIEGNAILYELHGRKHKPVSRNRLRDMLIEIRQARLR
jgi:hypothetical protein